MKDLAIYLQGRGCLSRDFDAEYEQLVLESVQEIRASLDAALPKLTAGSGAYRAVDGMRHAARSFMNAVPPPIDVSFSYMRPEYREQLMEVRNRFRAALEALDDGLGLPEAAQAASVIPSTIEAPPFEESQLAPTRTIFVAPPKDVPPQRPRRD